MYSNVLKKLSGTREHWHFSKSKHSPSSSKHAVQTTLGVYRKEGSVAAHICWNFSPFSGRDVI